MATRRENVTSIILVNMIQEDTAIGVGCGGQRAVYMVQVDSEECEASEARASEELGVA